MKQLIVVFMIFLTWQSVAQADLTIEITEGVEGALPIAVVPFGWQGKKPPSENVASIIDADLHRSGRFKTLPQVDMLARPTSGDQVQFKDWRALGTEYLVVGQIQQTGVKGYTVRFQLFDVYRGEQLTGYSIPTTEPNLRSTAHRIADLIYEKLMGVPGAFATRVAYITSVRVAAEQGREKSRIDLRIADADGHNPQTIVSSSEPLMSPAWSPDGRKIAYVSFEEGQSAIYLQEVFTGNRQKVTSFKGINGAPAWSPDGRKLAMALSKGGNLDIYVFDLATKKLKQITHHYAIDTEPAWSPDGRLIAFTSDRGGRPQIYQVPSYGGKAKRLTFQNAYNARASFSADGKSLALVTREEGNYRIAVQDLESGIMQVLSSGNLDESPSFAPNGSMIIYASKAGYRGVLAAVSVDGRVRQRLALQEGDVREPVWSPFEK
ncbi:MAG: Tol-Pal system beta propeller repeat protein TolB [Pseudomonadota bacterium]